MSPLNLHNISVNYCFSARMCSCMAYQLPWTGCYCVQGTPILQLRQHHYLDSSYQERKTNITNISLEVIPFKGDSRNLLNLEIVMSSSAERVWET